MVLLQTHGYDYWIKRLPSATHRPDEHDVTVIIYVQKVLAHYHSSTPARSDGHPLSFYQYLVGPPEYRRFTVGRRQTLSDLQAISDNLSGMGVGPEWYRMNILTWKLYDFIESMTVTGGPGEQPVAMLYVRAVEYRKDDRVNVVAKVTDFDLKRVRFDKELRNVMEQCLICMEEFELGMEVTRMPCWHVYHNKCIADLLKTSLHCPLCRSSLLGRRR